jgi:hypothetical protein
MHNTPHPLAGQTVTVQPAAALYSYNGTEPIQFRVEDWNDRVFGRSWMLYEGHPASLGYAVRSAMGGLPTDNEVVYGKCDRNLGHLVHVSEIKGGAA